MQSPTMADIAVSNRTLSNDANLAGISWSAILAGAAAAAALSFILLILGVGLGLSSMSPYAYHSAPMGSASIGWLAFTQLAASGIGGYIAGRLRVKWANVHGDEVHFRDTAHGLLAWAVATSIAVSVLAGGASAVLGAAINATANTSAIASPESALGAAAKNIVGSAGNSLDYFSDMLLRSGAASVTDNSRQAEVNRIFVANFAAGPLSAEDRGYLAQLVSNRSGLTDVDARRRVDDIYTRAFKAASDARSAAVQAADQARKTAAHSALWMFVALLLGAFTASLSATFGGLQRDHARTILSSST